MSDLPPPCDRWCPFSACSTCAYKGGEAPVDDADVMSARLATIEEGRGRTGIRTAPGPNPSERKRLP